LKHFVLKNVHYDLFIVPYLKNNCAFSRDIPFKS
jgi:hypothetical protein